MNDHGARLHSVYGASSAYRWFACPGSVGLLNSQPPLPTSAAAAEGTRAHEYLEQCLLLDFDAAELVPPTEPEDMAPSIQVALDYVRDLVDRDPGAQVYFETSFAIPSSVAPGQVFGTNDICVYLPATRTMYVPDYKHGAGVRVRVENNKQCKFYGLGALLAHPEWQIDTVVLVIIQPRKGGVSEWPTTPIHLLDFMLEIEEGIAATKVFGAPLVAGEEQCHFCTPNCPARQQQALTTAGQQFADINQIAVDVLPDPAQLGVARCADILSKRAFYDHFMNSVEEFLYAEARAGKPVPGFKLVEAQGRRRWEGEPADIAEALMLATGLELDDVMPRKLTNITEVEPKVVRAYKEGVTGKGAKAKAAERANDFFSTLTTKSSSGNLSLVPVSDARQAVDAGQRDFGDIQLPMVPLPAIESK